MKLTTTILVLALAFTGAPALAKDKVILSAIQGSMNSLVSETVMREAYKRIGIEVSILQLPGKRALVTSNAGEVDGELFRINGMAKKFKNLIQIQQPINLLEGIIIGKTHYPNVKTWDDIWPYRVGIQRGIKFVEKGVAQVTDLRLMTVNNNSQLIQAILDSRIEIGILARLNAIDAINKAGADHLLISEPPIVTHRLYHYVHKSNRSLVPKLESALRKMDSEGLIKKIRRDFIKSLLGRQNPI